MWKEEEGRWRRRWRKNDVKMKSSRTTEREKRTEEKRTEEKKNDKGEKNNKNGSRRKRREEGGVGVESRMRRCKGGAQGE